MAEDMKSWETAAADVEQAFIFANQLIHEFWNQELLVEPSDDAESNRVVTEIAKMVIDRKSAVEIAGGNR